MIERVRISAQGKNQLIQLKRKTGIQKYNTICRYALVLSLSENTKPPLENLRKEGGLEIDWKTFCSGECALYENLLRNRCLEEGLEVEDNTLKSLLDLHLHRGLSYLFSNPSQLLIGCK